MRNKLSRIRLLKRGFRIVFYSTSAVLFLMIGYAHLHRFFEKEQNRLPVAFQDMLKLSRALQFYMLKNDILPYDSRGSQYALYKLKPHLNGFPSSLPKECWDDENKMLRVLPYNYLNVSNIDPYADSSNPSNNIIIMTERIKPGVKGINIITLNGNVLWYQPQDITIQEVEPVVGKYLAELRSPNWTSYRGPGVPRKNTSSLITNEISGSNERSDGRR